jgi:hypothetical protein
MNRWLYMYKTLHASQCYRGTGKLGKARVWIVNMDVEARQASEVP